MISASLSPNTEKDDVLLALKTMLTPWQWKAGKNLVKVKAWFKSYFSGQEAVLFNSGRSAELAIFKAFGIGEGDEVLVQAFTCVAVPNSVIRAGARPVFADVDETLNIDPNSLESKISAKTKAIIVQHTFGIPAQMDKLVNLARRHRLILVEDCAHSLGATFHGQRVGTFGDAAFFSFGRDKVLSSVFGGAAIIKSNLKNQISKIKQYQEDLSYPSRFWIFQQLLHPIAFSVILPLYDVIIGKLLLVLWQKLGLLSLPVYPQEKQGQLPRDFPAKYPAALASLLWQQLGKLERYNRMRRETADFYRKKLTAGRKAKVVPDIDGAIYLRFPVEMQNPDRIRLKAKNAGILLGNWYHRVIDPDGVDFRCIGYHPGTCPKAEAKAATIVNLPTLLTLRQAERVTSVLL